MAFKFESLKNLARISKIC